MATLRPGFGPSLPDLLAPRLGWPLQRVRVVLLGLFAVAVVVQGARIVLADPSGLSEEVLVRTPIAYNLAHREDLRRVAPRGAETLRLTSAPGAKTRETFTVAPLRLPPYRGDSAGILPVAAAREVARLRQEFGTEFRYRGDSRARINESPGHQIAFQARIGGRLHYGKRYLLVPAVAEGAAQPREGAVLTLVSRYSKATPSVEAVGVFGLMKGPLRSFRFGTERP